MAITDLLPTMPNGTSTSNKEVAAEFAKQEWTDKLWHSGRNICTYKSVQKHFVDDPKAFKVMQRLLLFNGSKALHDSAIKLEAIPGVLQDNAERILEFVGLVDIGLKRRSLDIEKLGLAALKGRP